MEEDDFEGTLVLEKLAELGLVDDFFEAIDSDNIEKTISLMKKAEINVETIKLVIKKIRESN